MESDFELRFIKTHPDAKLPVKKSEDTGYDVYAVEEVVIQPGKSAVVPVGLKFGHIPSGYWVRLATRSGHGFKRDLSVFPGVIDEGYRGDAGIKVYNLGWVEQKIEKGERFAQMIVCKRYDPEVKWTDIPTASERGEGGFNSTGVK